MQTYQTLAARPRQSLRARHLEIRPICRGMVILGLPSLAVKPAEARRLTAWIPARFTAAVVGNGKLIASIPYYRPPPCIAARTQPKFEGSQVDFALDRNYVPGLRLFSIRRSRGGRPDQGKPL